MATKTKKESPVVASTTGEIATEVEENVSVEAVGELEDDIAPAAPKAPVAEKDAMAEKAAELFALYPSYNLLHFTMDGTAFFELADATNHALSLADKNVRTINR